MTATVTTAAAILKRLYPQKAVEAALYKNGPFYGMVPKSTKFTGADMRIALQTSPNTGRSASFATAQSNVGPNGYVGFNLTRAKDYAVMRIENELLQAAEGDSGSLVRGLKKEMDGTINALSRSICRSLYRNGGGALGRVGSTATTTLTLLNRTDIVNFEVGMRIASSTTDGTSGSVDAENAVITAVDRNLGTITRSDANWTASGNFSDNDYLFAQSDFGVMPAGLAAWIPPSAPSSTAFFGVDRTAGDVQRMSGVRFTADSDAHGNIENALIQAAAELVLAGGAPSHIFMNPLDYAQFSREQSDKRVYHSDTARSASGVYATVGYSGLKLAAGNGDVGIFADRDCPRHRAYMLQMDTWILKSLNELPQWLLEQGPGNSGAFYPVSNADSWEARLGGYFNLGCEAPGYNCTIDLTELTAA